MLHRPTTSLAVLGVTPEQIANLQTLAAWLVTHADEINFNMQIFGRPARDAGNVEYPSDDPLDLWTFVAKHDCGAVGCAVGHGPAAGIAPLPGESWVAYASRTFGVEAGDTYAHGDLWEFLFDSEWYDVDNTASGAGKRILWAIENGVPDAYDVELMTGDDAPLCYETAL